MVVDDGKLNRAVVRQEMSEGWEGVECAGVTAGIHLAPKFVRTFFDCVCKGQLEVVNSDGPDLYAWVLEGVDLGAGK